MEQPIPPKKYTHKTNGGIKDSKIDRSNCGFINKVTNFREHDISFNKFQGCLT